MIILSQICLVFVSGGTDESRQLKFLQVEGVFHRYLELRECKPRLSKLRSILSEVTYSGPQSVDVKGPTMSVLLDRVQCSESELKQGSQHFLLLLYMYSV